jgi:hypothetical protein
MDAAGATVPPTPQNFASISAPPVPVPAAGPWARVILIAALAGCLSSAFIRREGRA